MGSKFFIALSMFVLIIRLSAQPYPVDASLQVHPPFSPYLEEWASPHQSAVQVVLRLLDQAEQQYPVQLRFSWVGQGISIKTRSTAILPAIYLDFGVPQLLSAHDLAAYFDWNQLDIQGIDPVTLWQNGGRLPEGMYNFCVEVLSANRPLEAAISNQACRVVQLASLPPPSLLFPTNYTLVEALPIPFQWVPQHVGAFPVSYTMRIFEDRQGLSPAQILLLTTPIFQTNTGAQRQFLYDWDEPPLETGTRYLAQVAVEDLSGTHQFQANGYSELIFFDFGIDTSATCSLLYPVLTMQEIDSQGVTVCWNEIANIHAYEIELSTDSTFQEKLSTYPTHSVTDTSFRFSGLSTQYPYFVRIRSTAGECFSAYSPTLNIQLGTRCSPTRSPAPLSFSCGQADEEIQLTTAISMPYLYAGDTIWANEFPLIVRSVRGTGPFSGEAYGKVSYLKSAQVNYEMQGIEIDPSCQLIAGRLVVTGGGLALLNASDLDLLVDILASLETLDDWLAVSEEVLQGVDQILAEIEVYLPEEILQNLSRARARLEAAEAAYEAALASGDPALIAAAKEELEAATDALQEALTNYKAALQQFLGTWLGVLGQLLLELLEDCLWDQLRMAHELAENTLQAFIQTEREDALLQIPANGNNGLGLTEEFETVFIEADSLSAPQAFDDLSSEFYGTEMDYLLCIALEQLQAEVQSTEAMATFQDLLQEINAHSLDIIGEAIAQGLATEDIVPLVKNALLEDLQVLLRRSHYPTSVTSSNQ